MIIRNSRDEQDFIEAAVVAFIIIFIIVLVIISLARLQNRAPVIGFTETPGYWQGTHPTVIRTATFGQSNNFQPTSCPALVVQRTTRQHATPMHHSDHIDRQQRKTVVTQKFQTTGQVPIFRSDPPNNLPYAPGQYEGPFTPSAPPMQQSTWENTIPHQFPPPTSRQSQPLPPGINAPPTVFRNQPLPPTATGHFRTPASPMRGVGQPLPIRPNPHNHR